MTERPILMSAPMVRAILAGAKTVTRRIVKLPPGSGQVHIDRGGTIFGPGPYLKVEKQPCADGDATMHPRIYSPYGYPGERLWVKEAIALDDRDTPVYVADDQVILDLATPITWCWKRRSLSSMFMPRGLSRITLEVVDVRVERLHAITEEDAKREGVTPYEFSRRVYPSARAAEQITLSYREGFRSLWDALNNKRAPWASNPWVWVISFRRTT